MAGPDPHDLPDLASLLNRPEWMAEAVCQGMDVEVFVPPLGGSGPGRAKAVCGCCSVREPCLAFALADVELAGVWGGTTARERRVMRGGSRRSPRLKKHASPTVRPRSGGATSLA